MEDQTRYRQSRWRKVPNRFPKQSLWKTILILIILFLVGIFRPDLRDKVASNSDSRPDSSDTASGNPVSTEESKTPSTGQVDPPIPSPPPLREGTWQVVHFSDGDTFDVQDNTGTNYRIRLIGSNTPETVKENSPVEPFGPEASGFTKGVILKHGARVRIAFDGDRIDRYGRTLAMVYIPTPQGELWLNELLIREGLAKAELQYRYSNEAKRRFSNAQFLAQQEKTGIWSLPPMP